MSTLQLYGQFAGSIGGGYGGGDGPIDYLTDVIRFTLHTSSYTPDIDAHIARTSISASELPTANGYTVNGIIIAGKTVVYTGATNITTFDMDDTSVVWTASGAGLTFKYAILWDDTVTSPVDPLIGYIDCGAQTITAGNTFTITTGATGLFQATVT
jgi:hypothetical protein